MALGGGLWTVQNKVLPGTYINFASTAKASAALSDRGYVAMPLMLDWGIEGKVFTVTSADFQKNCLKLFGHNYNDDEMLPLRELFMNAQTLYTYRLNGGGAKASNTFCTAKYTGTAGNKLYVVIATNADSTSMFDVSLYYDTTLLDAQTVATATALKDNDFVTWKTNATLEVTTKTALTGGTNGTANAAAHQAALDKFESYSFNTLGCPTDDNTTAKLYMNYTKRMRDEIGAKFQTVIFNLSSNAKIADYEGVIEVASKATDYPSNVAGIGQYALVYWVTGASAGCAVNKSNTNKKYDGELSIDVDKTQADLAADIEAGRFVMHNVNGDVRVLEDINSLTTTSDTKGDIFKSNQTIRVCDQIANDAAVLFNTRYLGVVANDAAGRISLWNDICKLHQALENIRAIENFEPDSVTVEQGETKRSVLCTIKDLNIINAMEQLYMSIVIM